MQRNTWFRKAALAAAIVFVCGVNSGRAQETGAGAPPEPGRGVARLSLINGEVSVRRGDSGDWVAAVANAPVSVDDHLATGAGARAEVQFDAANFLRAGANSEVQFAQIEQNRYQMQLARGTVDFSVLRQTSADIEIDTPSVSVRPRERGNYRITVMDDGQSEITVRAGQAEIYTPRGVETLSAGKTMMVRGDPSNPEYQIVAAVALDEWDRWNADRDRGLETAGNNVYNRYVSPDVYGAESLEGHGRWVYTPEYGWVWTPSVAPGWAPYRDGRWAWADDYYGWSWVGYEPWGWAPYHYGRWFFNAGYGGWCWWPGSIYARHYWAPAYVGFFGFGGGGFGVGFGFGNLGWVPLAPYEVYHPWWGRGFYGRNNFYGRGTILNNANIYNTYRNARVANGVTAVNARDFASGHFRNFTRVSQNDLRSVGMVQGRLGIAPTAQTRRFSDRAVTNIPRQSANQRFFTRNGPVMAGQRTGSTPAGRSMGAMPGGASTSGSFRPGNTPRGNTAPSVMAGRGDGLRTPANSGGSWRRFGDPSAGSNVPAQRSMGSMAQPRGAASPRNAMPSRDMNRGSVANGGAGGGWRRFGDPGAQSPAAGSGVSRDNPRGGNWQRFGSPGAGSSPRSFTAPNRDSGGRLEVSPPMVRERSAPQQSAPQSNRPSSNAPQYSRPSYSAPQYSPRSDPRSFGSAPRSTPSPRYEGGGRSFGGGGGSYSAPRSAPSYGGGGSYSAPRSAPSYGGGGGRSFGGGGGSYSAPRSAPSYGGGGGRSSGGGGGHSGGGGHGGRR